jgi:L,D-peptidoglycan transpeptidase YkuD (ErfK/YbiS/YcfS/YnhG family)
MPYCRIPVRLGLLSATATGALLATSLASAAALAPPPMPTPGRSATTPLATEFAAAGPGPARSGATAAHVAGASSCPGIPGAPLPGVVGLAETNRAGCDGFWVVNGAGQVSAFGAAGWLGDLRHQHLDAPIVGMAATPDGGGYWLVAADGGIFSFGDAAFHGSVGGHPLVRPVVGMAATADGGGYWLVAADGGIFSFGDAAFHGSMGGHPLVEPMVGIAAGAQGGYWTVAADGGIFSFDEPFRGSIGGHPLNQPVTGMTTGPGGDSYTMVARDGGVFNFGTTFAGSLGSSPPAAPVVAIGGSATSAGYRLVDRAGHVYPFGGAADLGSAACPSFAGAAANPNAMLDTGGGSQLITVVGSYSGSSQASLTAWTQAGSGCWAPAALSGVPSVALTAQVGYDAATGANLADHRREGDGSTPTGVYAFGPTLYGNDPTSPNSAYPYHVLTCGDWWDEQPGTPQYNEFVHVPCGTNPGFAGDSEALWTEVSAYQHFAVVEFNPAPTTDPIGSGVFLHDDVPSGYTAGCVALPSAELDAVLAWMQPGASPHIAIGTAAEMDGF